MSALMKERKKLTMDCVVSRHPAAADPDRAYHGQDID